MAQTIDLGYVKGVSQRVMGNWASGTEYTNDEKYIDVVAYNGSSYACIKSHTASSTITPENATYWMKQAAKGEKGDKGDTGAAGAAGPQGPKGDTGAAGAKGDAFTYDDFTPEQLAALKGEKGDKGDTGATGAQGAAGADGKTPTFSINSEGHLIASYE